MHSISIKNQQGYTLIELLVAGVLGLFIMGGVINMFVSSSQTTTLQGAVGDLQERSRFISMFLTSEFERAGWLDPTMAGSIPTAVTFGGGETGEDVTVCDAAVSGANMCDRIRITYNGIRDCLGAQVNGGAMGVVTNTFFVQNGDLMCEGVNAGVSDIIVNDVESFHLLYGLDDSDGSGLPYTSDTDIKDGLIDRYVEAFDFNASGLETLMAIRFAVLLRSTEENALDAESLDEDDINFTLFNEPELEFEDRRLRILVTGTSVVSNGN